MTDERPTPQEKRKRRLVGPLVALVILAATPFLVVRGLEVTTTTQFARLEAEWGTQPYAMARFDAFEHGYSSGVVAVLLGRDVARLSGQLVELWEQDPCRERLKDLLNNAAGRNLALRIYEAGEQGWRERFATTLYLEIRQANSDFVLGPKRNATIGDACGS